MTDDLDFSIMLKTCDEAALNSNDPNTKVGCVIVVGDWDHVIHGWNHTPCGVELTAERSERPAKYDFVEHAERNAIYKAARAGTPLDGAVLYMQSVPCADCARAVVQCGIAGLHYSAERQKQRDSPRYKEFQTPLTILMEGGVNVTAH